MVIPELPYDDDDLSTLERGLRQYMITKIVREAVPRPNSDAKNDARMIELKEYATFMEKKSFEKVQTKDEYYAELARIILSMQKHLQSRPKGSYEDPYSNIPPSHELADFLGLSAQERDEFYLLHPHRLLKPNAKSRITRRIRIHVIDKLGLMLFPAPDQNAYYDGRMDRIIRKLRNLEAEAFRECIDCDDYYNLASIKAYKLHKTMKKNGEHYVDHEVKYPAIHIYTSANSFESFALAESGIVIE
ncbi:KIX domain-containing protein [Caenorhabditis elegans]|uniref:KIX domain-containing protein n=1 Tax=Caenorhabditis elegans TaxID=6239 RepID=Q19744_CAEEL|nr:KIX domain-containing protein [Caenorhabditis elegans]CCD62512.1 KIX domain-containing protein [Caenorhabditis elegans]|eukprot:NP_509376.2 Uncharacterized protein CELE_F22F1.3 [Caenorhabditis elegans]